jgi:hypothetical protein
VVLWFELGALGLLGGNSTLRAIPPNLRKKIFNLKHIPDMFLTTLIIKIKPEEINKM